MHSGHGAQWDTNLSVAPYEIYIAVAQVYVSTDPREEVSQQTGCTCFSENEILTSFHQPKKGRTPDLDEISPECRNWEEMIMSLLKVLDQLYLEP